MTAKSARTVVRCVCGYAWIKWAASKAERCPSCHSRHVQVDGELKVQGPATRSRLVGDRAARA